jgi:hypothetical protein
MYGWIKPRNSPSFLRPARALPMFSAEGLYNSFSVAPPLFAALEEVF